MTDKRVMNQYIPADFDPNKLLPMKGLSGGRKKAGPREMQVRMMMPFTMQCAHCNQYMQIATKFNSRCAKLTEELGVDVYRFIGKCRYCLGEFQFRSDPKTSDYVLESGGIRAYEANKDAEIATVMAQAEAEEMDEQEKKIYDTQAEMRRILEIEQLKSLNKAEGKGRETLIDVAREKRKRGEEEEWSEEWHRQHLQREQSEELQDETKMKNKRKNVVIQGYDSDSD